MVPLSWLVNTSMKRYNLVNVKHTENHTNTITSNDELNQDIHLHRIYSLLLHISIVAYVCCTKVQDKIYEKWRYGIFVAFFWQCQWWWSIPCFQSTLLICIKDEYDKKWVEYVNWHFQQHSIVNDSMFIQSFIHICLINKMTCRKPYNNKKAHEK